MTIEELLDIYANYAFTQNLSPSYHRTNLALMVSRIGSIMSWFSDSKNKSTDTMTRMITELSEQYELLGLLEQDYDDNSTVFLLNNEIPELLIDKLVDLVLHIFMYIGGNGWSEKFIFKLKKKLLEDNAVTTSEKGRFKNVRLGRDNGNRNK